MTHYRFGYACAIPFRSFPETVMLGTISPMDASTARTFNMRRLVAAAGGPAEWARLHGGTRWTQPQVSQWISDSSPKGIGNRLARDLEAAMTLPHGALDRADDSGPLPPSQLVGLDFEKIAAAVNVLTHYLELVNDPPEWVHDPILLETAYMVVEEFGQPTAPSNVLDLTKLLSKRLRGAKDEQHEVRGTGSAARR